MKHPRLLEKDELRADVQLGKVYRTIPLDVTSSSLETRADSDDSEPEAELLEMEFAFASEAPVERFFGFEELEVTPSAARLDRVAQGVAPVLENHISGLVVGRVLAVKIGSDRIARARVRFSRSAAARDVVQDVVDGIRQGISFGYRVHKMELVEAGDDGDRFRVTDWELFEITIASMPADPTVGSHRSATEDKFETSVSRKAQPMKVRALHVSTGSLVEIDESKLDGVEFIRAAEPTAPAPAAPAAPSAPKVGTDRSEPTADQVRLSERERIANIESLGRDLNVSADLVRAAVEKGVSVDLFVGEIRLERAKSGEPLTPPDTDLGLSRGEVEKFSIIAAINDSLDRKKGARDLNSRELEMSDAIADKLGRRAQGFFVPYDVLARSAWGPSADELSTRAATDTGVASGGSLVGTDLMSQNFIDLLRNRSVLGRLGATIIPGLVGNVDFPKQLTDAAVAWVAEGAGTGDTGLTFGTVSMSPKTIRSRADVTRRMLQQSTPAVEQIVRNSINIAIAKAIDIAGIDGSGTAPEPEGIINTSGIGSVSYVATNGTTEYQSVIELETAVAEANADEGGLGYLTTPTVRGRLKGTFRDVGSAAIWEGSRGMGELVGYQAEVSNALPKTLGAGSAHPIVAGHWPSLYIGEWGVLDLMPDEITLGDSGGLVLRGFQDADVAVAHAVAFALTTLVP